MQINEKQKTILDGFHCKRVHCINSESLDAICGPVVDGINRSSLVDHFRSPKHIADDASRTLASYVITNNKEEILLFFSIRCGELFEKIDHRKMILSHNALVGVQTLQQNEGLTEEEKHKALESIKDALKEGLSYEDFSFYAKKKHNYIGDISKEPNNDVSRVSVVYSGVELKFFGINDNAKVYWNNLKMPRKMGETLFWYFIVPKLENLRSIVGCQYLYLFAADREADGHLVAYYKTILHIDSSVGLSSNKPYFDYQSVFLYQDISRLSNYRQLFLDTFNPDMSEEDAV